LPVELMHHQNSLHILEVSTVNMTQIHKLIIFLLLLVGDKAQVEKIIGSEEIHGVPTGVNTISSELKWVATIWVLKAVAIGQYQLLMELMTIYILMEEFSWKIFFGHLRKTAFDLKDE